LKSLFSLVAILDIGHRDIPTHGPPVLISQRIKTEKKPAISTVSTAQTLVNVKHIAGID
jgi:hypothetical protein